MIERAHISTRVVGEYRFSVESSLQIEAIPTSNGLWLRADLRPLSLRVAGPQGRFRLTLADPAAPRQQTR